MDDVLFLKLDANKCKRWRMFYIIKQLFSPQEGVKKGINKEKEKGVKKRKKDWWKKGSKYTIILVCPVESNKKAG